MPAPRHTDLEEFLQALAQRRDDARVRNPYRLPGRLQNLRAYLQQALDCDGRRILLIGEAPGYRGCFLTGVPFSSERLLRRAPHAFLRRLRPALALQGNQSEATASLVWQALAGRRTIPLFWNAFPFHPHEYDRPDSNRAPTAAEVEEGAWYLSQLAELFQPWQVAGVGRRGHDAAMLALPQHSPELIRHPSYGGKADFNAGLARLYRRRVTAGPG